MNLSTKKKTEMLRKQQKEIEKMREENRCSCRHVNKGDFDAVRKQGVSEPIFICKRCEKELNLRKINEDKLEEALYTIDQAIDVIKIGLGEELNEAEEKIYKRLVKAQYTARNLIKPLYQATLSSNNKKNKNRNRSNNTDSGNSVWMQSRVRG